MRKLVIASVVILAIAVGVPPAAAQFASPLQILPVVAKVAGAQGTDWRSDMAISNLSDSAVTVGLQFFREARANTFTGSFAKTITLAAGETRVVEDVLGTFFPSEGNTKGMLLVMATSGGGADGGMLAVGSRTYNAANPNATYGQSVSPSFVSFIVGLGRSVIPGASWNTKVRTNIGVCNFGPQSTAIVIEIYNGAGALVKSVSTSVEAFSLRQWGLADLGVSSLTGGRVEVRLDSAASGFDPCDSTFTGWTPFVSGLVMAYYSKVDNATGDAEFGYGQLDWSDFIAECDTDPTDPCGTGGMASRAAAALGVTLPD
jgi:hypothetical protein